MKRYLFGLGMALFCTNLVAQSFEPTARLDLEVRLDHQTEQIDGTTNDDNSGFKGKYLNLQLTGELAPNLTYLWRQRMNKSSYNSSYFDATEYIYLVYSPNQHWNFSAGKQAVAIGGFEYDRSPINLYRCSEFWNNIPSHQYGMSALYTTTSEKDMFLGQICTNPFRELSNDNTYAYNFMWIGEHGWLNTLYSANLIEYQPGRYINYLTLGHQLNFGKTTLELDFMNRAASHQTFFTKDASVMAEISYHAGDNLRLYAKGTYDVNHTSTDADYTVMSGTEIKLVGAGLEYRPLKEHRQELRFHANCFYSWGRNTNPDATLRNDQTIASIGVTWHMNVLKTK